MSSKRDRKVVNKIPFLYPLPILYLYLVHLFFLHTTIKFAFLSLDKNHQQSHPN